jgi:hypothetical protein
MIWPAFCLNERAFHHVRSGVQIGKNSLTYFLAMLEDTISITEQPIHVSNDIYSVEVDSEGTQLSSFLYTDNQSVERDTKRRLQIIISRCKFIDDIPQDQIQDAMVRQNSLDTQTRSAAITYVAKTTINGGGYFGILSRGEDGLQPGTASIQLGKQAACSFIVCSASDISFVYREAIQALCETESSFFELSNKAFPSLLFHSTLSFGHFSKKFPQIIPVVCDHLAFLNDEFLNLANNCKWNYGAMTAGATVPFSDETAGTKNNRQAMRQREVQLHGKTIYCTLHTKLSPTADRIHFHPPTKEMNLDKILVGIFTAHLDT